MFGAPKFTIQTYGEMGTRVLAIWWVPGPESAKIYCARRCLLILFTRCRLIFSHLGAAAIGVSDYFRDIVHIFYFKIGPKILKFTGKFRGHATHQVFEKKMGL